MAVYMPNTVQELRATESSLRQDYGDFYDFVLGELTAADPLEVDYGDAEEYHAEAQAVLMEFKNAASVSDISHLLWRVFVAYSDEETAGSIEQYRGLAVRLWEAAVSRGRTGSPPFEVT